MGVMGGKRDGKRETGGNTKMVMGWRWDGKGRDQWDGIRGKGSKGRDHREGIIGKGDMGDGVIWVLWFILIYTPRASVLGDSVRRSIEFS